MDVQLGETLLSSSSLIKSDVETVGKITLAWPIRSKVRIIPMLVEECRGLICRGAPSRLLLVD